jgi:hypothetical protein
MPFTNVMPQFKAGKLKSGSGKPVKDRKQAIAIMLSEKSKADSGEKPEYKPGFSGVKRK